MFLNSYNSGCLEMIQQIIRYLPYLIPYKVGHPPCKLYLFLVPSVFRLYQNTTDPLVGQATRPTIGNTVPPPSTSEN